MAVDGNAIIINDGLNPSKYTKSRKVYTPKYLREKESNVNRVQSAILSERIDLDKLDRMKLPLPPKTQESYLIRCSVTLIKAQELLLSHMDIPKNILHRRAIEHFLYIDDSIDSRWMIKNRSDSLYIKRPLNEQVFVPNEYKIKLDEIVELNGLTRSIVINVALTKYYSIMLLKQLTESELNLLL